ncbi:MAG: PDZ domain-containing protein [Candidatus Eisenbacteria bacterium]|uniref:PDZ domain-containing protein n=1 Tax=Eiseniibacteriota bacterium TaxID=2212470 RepID=A0A538U8V6_UNCEI|nr:MAG: PDZ domain-containing protein [Candidatus Eisenbacteria bacterium]
MSRRWLGCGGVALALVLMAGGSHAQGALSALQTDMDQIAQRARPAVVTVFAQRTLPPKAGPRGLERRTRTRVGSGVAVEENGILTTASVVMNAQRVVIRTANGLQAEAQVAGLDPIFNLALLRVSSVRLPAVRFGDAKDGQIGSWVISLGTSYRAQPTQSVGNVAYRYREPHQSLLQLTNTVYPGNSGAAALNSRGELMGIVQGELSPPEPADADPGDERRPGGASFVLPIETVRPVFESLRRSGRVPHGFLGVRTRAASVQAVTGGDKTPIGALVESVVPGGPAESVGIKPGDLIVAFEGERVEYPEQLARWVAATRPGAPVKLVWVRDEIGRTGRATLGESPDPIPQWVLNDADAETPQPPVRVSELEREIRRLSDELERIKTSGQR